MIYFTIGTDTELFAQDINGYHVALCGKIGGTKDEPEHMQYLPYGFAYQEDNVAVEFNIPPASDRTNFSAFVRTAFYTIAQKLEKLGLVIAKDCAVSFDKKELTHPNALVFGCEPDYDAWKMVENKKPVCDNPQLRTAGGHIHVGCNEVDMVTGVQNMDLFLGVPSIILDKSPQSQERRKLYGNPGAMRPKSYGWEYRVLSNFWVFDQKLINWVFDATSKAVNYKDKFTKKEAQIIQDCIRNSDTKKAMELIKHYKLVMPEGWENATD